MADRSGRNRDILMTGLSRIFTVAAVLIIMTSADTAISQPVGEFDGHGDVGNPRLSGDAVYGAETQEYLVTGAGYNIWFDHDEFHFVWKKLTGDFILRAEGRFLGEGVDPHRKMGWMVRSGLDSNATHVNAVVHGDGLTSLQMRRETGAETEEVRSSVSGADVIQLARSGRSFTLAVARFGEPFSDEQSVDLDLGEEVYVGLFVSSHNEDVTEQAVFRNVRIIVPAPVDFVPYEDYIGSNLEVLEIQTGHRSILYRSPHSLQAPNWTPDGKNLIYNSNGLLYRFALEEGEPVEIDTDFAVQNNNDHVLSFDGRRLGISHHSPEADGHSLVYVVPAEGGVPRKVTEKGPSYLHGWSPDGKYLVYTAERGGDYDIYRILVDGGEEVRLTSTPGLDDGSEYTPDGRFIYFNSARTGRMEIWRMKSDGSEQQQVTDDAFNNWFPHISPDGKWILFLSYLPDVAPGDHPFYRHVYLRLMSIEGGAPRVAAYVYGGQGTINVPSWSPDSRKVAFVSNTAFPDPR